MTTHLVNSMTTTSWKTLNKNHSAKLLLITNLQEQYEMIILIMPSKIYTDEGRASEIVNV